MLKEPRSGYDRLRVEKATAASIRARPVIHRPRVMIRPMEVQSYSAIRSRKCGSLR